MTRRSTERPYLRIPDKWDGSPTTVRMHESLHMAAGILLGGWAHWIHVSKKRGYGRCRITSYGWGWREAAVDLAPYLINDLCENDVVMAHWGTNFSPYRLGYAASWLKRHRRKIKALARRIYKCMGPGPGTLRFHQPLYGKSRSKYPAHTIRIRGHYKLEARWAPLREGK